MLETHKHDIWLRRSPVNPQVTVVRHSDYTPQSMLHRSIFYKKLLLPSECEFGASVVAWRDTTWLATLTAMRSKEQGRLHRRANAGTTGPSASLCLRDSQNGRPSREPSLSVLVALFRLISSHGDHHSRLEPEGFAPQRDRQSALLSMEEREQHVHLQGSSRLQVPGDILAELERMRPSIMRQKWSHTPGGRRSIQFGYRHPTNASLSASIEFLPARSLSLSKGTFLLTLKEERLSRKETNSADKLTQLTRRERDCALLAAQGLHNRDIAQKLGKSEITVRNQLSSIYKKLGFKTRHELIAAFARLA